MIAFPSWNKSLKVLIMLNLDPYALEITEDIHEDEDNKSESGARWEHEDLAQVESFTVFF